MTGSYELFQVSIFSSFINKKAEIRNLTFLDSLNEHERTLKNGHI